MTSTTNLQPKYIHFGNDYIHKHVLVTTDYEQQNNLLLSIISFNKAIPWHHLACFIMQSKSTNNITYDVIFTQNTFAEQTWDAVL